MFLAAMQGTDPGALRGGPHRRRQHLAGSSGTSRCRRSGPVLMFLALMTIIWSFLVFDYIYIITQGGPNNATQVVGTLMYTEAFSDQAAGYASAMGLFLGVTQPSSWSSSTHGFVAGGGTYEPGRQPRGGRSVRQAASTSRGRHRRQAADAARSSTWSWPALAIYAIAPLVIVLFAALKSEQELAANPLGFPHPPGVEQLRQRPGPRATSAPACATAPSSPVARSSASASSRVWPPMPWRG